MKSINGKQLDYLFSVQELIDSKEKSYHVKQQLLSSIKLEFYTELLSSSIISRHECLLKSKSVIESNITSCRKIDNLISLLSQVIQSDIQASLSAVIEDAKEFDSPLLHTLAESCQALAVITKYTSFENIYHLVNIGATLCKLLGSTDATKYNVFSVWHLLDANSEPYLIDFIETLVFLAGTIDDTDKMKDILAALEEKKNEDGDIPAEASEEVLNLKTQFSQLRGSSFISVSIGILAGLNKPLAARLSRNPDLPYITVETFDEILNALEVLRFPRGVNKMARLLGVSVCTNLAREELKDLRTDNVTIESGRILSKGEGENGESVEVLNKNINTRMLNTVKRDILNTKATVTHGLEAIVTILKALDELI
jgi:hypothetical protein